MACVATPTAAPDPARGTRPLDPGSGACDPAEPGRRGHHGLAVQRADVLRGAVRLLLHDPRPRAGPLGRAHRDAQRAVRPRATPSSSSSPRCGASSVCSRRRRASSPGPPGTSLARVAAWGMREWYVLTYFFGAVFIAGQVYEYAHLVEEGVTLASDPYGSVFYLATGFHGLHVTGGLIAFLLIIGRTFTTRRYTHAQATGAVVDVVLLALRRRGVDRPVHHDLRPAVTAPDPDRAPNRRRRQERTRERTGSPPPAPGGDRHPDHPRPVPHGRRVRRRGTQAGRRHDQRAAGAVRRGGQGALPGELLLVPRPQRRGPRDGQRGQGRRPVARRGRRRRRRLPGGHRPDAVGRARTSRRPRSEVKFTQERDRRDRCLRRLARARPGGPERGGRRPDQG